MNNEYPQLTVRQLCSVIKMFDSSADDYLYLYDLDNDYFYMSVHATEKFPLERNEFNNVIEEYRKICYPEDFSMLEQELKGIISGKNNGHNLQYRWIDKELNPVWINCRGVVCKLKDSPRVLIGCANQIGAKQKADNVSGLLGQTSLEKYIQISSKIFKSGFVLRLGLDDFREINERYGIEYGDKVLKDTAECISGCLKGEQQLYRVVSDEFIIVDYLATGIDEAKSLYHSIRHAIDRYVESIQYEVMFTVSGGILDLATLEEKTYKNIMRYSEYALNKSKKNGKNQYYVFNYEDYNQFLMIKQLTQSLRKSVADNFKGYELYYQPLIDVVTGNVCGAEALLRYKSEDGNILPPNIFIPILEETGLVVPVGKWIINEAIKKCKEIQAVIPEFHININVSYIQVIKSNLVKDVTTAIEKYNINPSSIIIEMTESGLLESNKRYMKIWSALKERGVGLALDDFGTGYSNFNYMSQLEPDLIKIDRNFTAKALNNEYDYNMLTLIHKMVFNLGLKICIEGVETKEEMEKIKSMCPNFFQGYFFGRPCPYEDFVSQFVKNKK